MPDEEPKRHWINTFLTPQTIVYVLAGMVALVIFWTKTQESWSKVKELEGVIITLKEDKADKADVKSVEDRVTRQYETSGKISERVNALEKQQEYQRGLNEGSGESKPLK